MRHEHALGLYSRVLSNYKPSVLPRLIFSGWYTQWERTNRKSLEISKNSCYFGEQFCYMRLYLAPGLPNHFEDISEYLIYSVSLCFQTVYHFPHKVHDLIQGNKDVIFISVAYFHSTASDHNWCSVGISGINQWLTTIDATRIRFNY